MQKLFNFLSKVKIAKENLASAQGKGFSGQRCAKNFTNSNVEVTEKVNKELQSSRPTSHS